MAAPMRMCRFTFQNIKCSTIRLNQVRYSVKPPEWMGRAPAVYKIVDSPPDDVPTLAEKLAKENVIDEDIVKVPNIGEPFKSLKVSRKQQIAQQKLNKSNTDMERQARMNTLRIPLDIVNEVWLEEKRPEHLHSIAEHYGIYQDLFGGAYFYPNKVVSICYDYKDDLVTPVHHGNHIRPQEAQTAPHVEYDSEPDSLWTLVMTNPDGHLTHNDKEYLHWMVANIPGDDVSQGDVLCDYQSPFPPRGTGFHRHIFVLFKQDGRLDLSKEQRPPSCTSLEERTFKTLEFYKAQSEHLVPVGLQFFQSEWDPSVRNIYHNVFGMQEPEFEYQHPPFYHPPQKMYPWKQPFDRYYDRYRDKKDIAEEVLKKRLKATSLFSPGPHKDKYPLMYVWEHRSKTYKPSWLKKREEMMHRRIEQFKDL